jgi:hypothetical protein
MGVCVGTVSYNLLKNHKKIKINGGEAGMRQPFESAYFKKTKLYSDIKTWSQGKLKREILFC